jgi:hypothetical protein
MFLGEDDSELNGRGPVTDCGDAKLAQYRVWMLEQWENDCLIADHAADPIDTVASARDTACEALTVMQSALGDLESDGLDGDALMGTVLAVETTRRKLDAVNARLIGALEASGVCETKAGLGVKAWKANRTHGSAVTVGRELKIARTLARFSAFGEALAEGVISTDHVLALAAVCNDRTTGGLMEHEDTIVSFAKLHRYNTFVTYLRRLAAIIDQDGVEPDCGDRDTATMGRDLESHLHVSLELSGHNAIEIEAIINTEVDRQYRAAQREQDAVGLPVPTTAVLRARAIVELIRRGADANTTGSRSSASVILPVTVDRHGNPTAVHTTDGTEVDPLTAAVLACDAHFHRVIVDPANNPLNMARTARLFTPTQKQALIIRDGGCVFPGCDQPARRCAAHHRIAWNHDGLTNTDDGALLCPRHHGLVHSNQPWVILRYNIEDLPPELLEQHRARAASADLEPETDVRVIKTPAGRLLLAQNATDHHGPAPQRRQTAA